MKQVSIGIIGLGPDWSAQHVNVLATHCPMLKVRAVYDAVPARAEAAARALGAVAFTGVRALLQMPGLDALLVRDFAGLSRSLLRWLVEFGLPICAGPAHVLLERLTDAEKHSSLESPALREDLPIEFVPDLPLRFHPATVRLQELSATALGAPRRIEVTLGDADDALLPPELFRDSRSSVPGPLNGHRDRLLHWMDWARHVTQKRILGISREEATSPADSPVLRVWLGPKRLAEHDELHDLLRAAAASSEARPSSSADATEQTGLLEALSADQAPGHSPAPAASQLTECRIVLSRPTEATGQPRPPAIVRCPRGWVTIADPQRVRWQSEDGSVVTESLTQDRPGMAILWNTFARRVRGGLLPTASLQDLQAATAVRQIAERLPPGTLTTLPR